MLIDHLRKVMEQLAQQPDAVQEKYATEIELDLDMFEQQRIAAQLADPNATNLDYLLNRADEQSSQGKVYDLDSLLDTLDTLDSDE